MKHGHCMYFCGTAVLALLGLAASQERPGTPHSLIQYILRMIECNSPKEWLLSALWNIAIYPRWFWFGIIVGKPSGKWYCFMASWHLSWFTVYNQVDDTCVGLRCWRTCLDPQSCLNRLRGNLAGLYYIILYHIISYIYIIYIYIHRYNHTSVYRDSGFLKIFPLALVSVGHRFLCQGQKAKLHFGEDKPPQPGDKNMLVSPRYWIYWIRQTGDTPLKPGETHHIQEETHPRDSLTLDQNRPVGYTSISFGNHESHGSNNGKGDHQRLWFKFRN